MASATESSLIAKLESSDPRGIRAETLDFMRPFSDLIDFGEFESNSRKKKKASKTATTAKKKTAKSNASDQKSMRPLAKQYLQFISRALKILPNRLSDLQQFGGGDDAEAIGSEMFDVYRLCLDCLDCISPCLDCKPMSVQLQRMRLIHCLEGWGRYEEAEVLGFGILDGLRTAKTKKVEGRFVPDLGKDCVDSDLATLVVELVISILKCAFKSRRKEMVVYRRALSLVEQAEPSFRVLESKASERLSHSLWSNLYKCTHFMLEEDACFDGDLVHDFCITTLTKCLESSTKDQFLKLVNNLFSLVTSRRVSRPALILDMLKLLLDSISCKCKVGLEYTINDSLDLLHYCIKKCRLSSKATCNDVARLLERYVQVLPPIDSVLKLYVAGLYSTGGAFWLGTESENSESKSAARILLGDEDDLDCFGSLKCHFRIDQNKYCLSSDYGDKDLGITNTISDSQLCATCKNKHGKASFLSYLNALAFFCQPFAEILNKERKYIVSVKDFQTSPKLNYVHGAFHHFCDLLLVKISSTSEEKEKLYDIQKILLHVALASFTISVMADENVQASVAFELCCRASWTCVSLLCDKYKDITVEHHDDLSEETIVGFVTDGCAKSATHLDVLHQCGSSEMNAAIVHSLINWSLAANLFESLSAPRLLVKQWVKIICKQFKDALEDDATPSLYYLLSKSSKELSKRIMGTILEQELLAYEEMESHSRLCQKMQLKIINILLLNIYVSKDYYLQKSLLLIKKGRIFRAQGFDRLNDCIRCLSDAISILIEKPSGSFSCDASISYHLALAYALRALCTQEAQPNSEVILEDVHCALKLWSSIDWSLIIHHDLVTENPIMLLYCICDLLSLKLIILLLNLKDVPLKKCLAMLWSDRRLAHALCTAPVSEDFILDLSEQFDSHSDAVGFWISCMKDSQPLLTGFCQKLLLFDFISSEANHYHPGSSLTSNATIDEVKDVALTLISNVHEHSSAFLAGYLYYDLSERLVSAGQLLEALSYSREAFHLRGRLLQKKFVCMFDKFPKNSGEGGEGIGQSESSQTYLEAHASIATQVWPHVNGSWKYEGCNLSQWNVLECYLESILQLGTIYEATGNAPFAEALLLQGKHISSAEGLPIFRVVFASALGEIYCKKLLWELAESELKSAQKILVDCSTSFSCRRCKLTLEVALDQRIGDLTRRHAFANSKVFSVTSFFHSEDLYKAALEKLNLPEWEISLSFSDNPNHLSRREICSLKVGNEVSHATMETKNCRRPKKSSRLSTREKSQLNQRITCSQLTQDTSSNAQGTMKDVSHMKWENHRRRLLLRVLSGIGKCLWNIDKVHEMHQLFWQSISIILNKKPICGANCSIQWNNCPEYLELIGKEKLSVVICLVFLLEAYYLGCCKRSSSPVNFHYYFKSESPATTSPHPSKLANPPHPLPSPTTSCTSSPQSAPPSTTSAPPQPPPPPPPPPLRPPPRSPPLLPHLPIGSACHRHPDLLHRYMNYTPTLSRPSDLPLAESLLLRCHPLPRRRCFSPSPSSSQLGPNDLKALSSSNNNTTPTPVNPTQTYSTYWSLAVETEREREGVREILFPEVEGEAISFFLVGSSASSSSSSTQGGRRAAEVVKPEAVKTVSRLLSVVYLLSDSFEQFSLPAHSGKVLLERHWAVFFHQASLGTYLNHQFISDASRKLKICSSTYFEGTHLNNSCNTLMEASKFLRLAPEKLDDLEQFVIEFFEGLPSVPIICITLLSTDFAHLLWNILPCSPSFSTWMLLSRLGLKGQPIVLLLPIALIAEDLDGDTLPAREAVYEGKESDKKWQCPWSHTIVDDVAPQFKRILEENYLSSFSSLSVSQESRLLWWTWRRNLNDHLDKFLRDVEDHWFGPWRCLLMGESMKSLRLGSLLSKLTAELKSKCEFDADEEFLKLILGGARSVSEARSCISELVLHKGSIIRGRYCQEQNCQCSDVACNESNGLSESINQLISDTIIEFEVQCMNRQPVVLVLDSDVQMLPWENLPVLRTLEVYRMPSIGCISVVLNMNCHLQNRNVIGSGSAPFPSIDPLDAFYLLNPSGDLERTQIEFEDWFRDQRLEGKAGMAPTTEELALALKNHDLFIYFGHGNGTQYIHGREIQKLENCAATLLMGCSSGSLSLMGCYNPQGAVLSYLLAGSPAIIANLWEVTDKDIDRFGKAMLTAWLQERSSSTSGTERNNSLIEEFESLDINNKKGNVKKKAQKGRKTKKESESIPLKNSGNNNRPMIASFMSEARRACTLPFLIGAAPVCYGIPTTIRKKKDL
ncbi:hypothetical protein Syun_003084 [Stephania yunnanensis]|uniref:separase n=1 Tax=Stephania yunnanensis TaxID=152371 RepID=A0AAP0L278_9MAGN